MSQINYRDTETGIVHAPPVNGTDYVLCGNAMEGEVLCQIGEVEETQDGITCELCIATIRHCKSLRLPTLRGADLLSAPAKSKRLAQSANRTANARRWASKQR